jgi:hypothetical protein
MHLFNIFLLFGHLINTIFIFVELLPIYKDLKSNMELKKQRAKQSLTSTECDEDFSSRYTSDTLNTMLTNRSSSSMPLAAGNKLAFIQKYADEEATSSNAELPNETSELLVDETKL